MTRLIICFLAVFAMAGFANAGNNSNNGGENKAGFSPGACGGGAFVVTAGKAIDGAVRSGSASKFSAVASQYMDMTTIAYGALGQFRKKLPKDQEDEYLTLTNGFLGRFAIEHAKRFQTSNITVVNCQEQASNVTVNAKLGNGDKLIAKLQKTTSSYRIVDINLQSVWLVQQMRSAFVGTIRRDGFDALFRFLKS